MDMAEVLSGRAGLAGIQWALLGRPARKALRCALGALLADAGSLGPCRLRRAKFKPGRKLTAYYDVCLDTQSGGDAAKRSTRPIAVTWMPQGAEDRRSATPALVDMQNAALRRGLAAPFHQLVVEAPARGMHIQVSPLDACFPQLVRMSDPRYVRDMFAAASAAIASAPVQESDTQYKVTPIRYRPGQRHVLRYDPLHATRRAGGHTTVFAKLYADVEEGARSFRVATRVADWLAAHGDSVTSVRPVAYLAEDAAILYPRVVGRPLSQHLRRPARDLVRYIWLVGSALRSLHDASVGLTDDLEQHTFTVEVEEIARASEHVHALLPAVGATIGEILDRAQELHERLPQESPTFVHGDFKADHLLVTPAGLTLLDFGSCSLADPALDVGKFLADLQWWHAIYDQPGLEQAQALFLEGYALDAPHARLGRARLYQALILVKITVRRVHLFDHDWALRTARLIGHTKEALRDLEASLRYPVTY